MPGGSVKTTVVILGEPELQAWFDDLDAALSEDTLVSAAQAGGLPIQNSAKEKAPKRTRTLSRSIHMEVVKRSSSYAEVAIGTDLESAPIHEFGGTITPKTAKFLAIPVTEEAQQYVSPLNFPRELHFVLGKTGGVLMDENDTAHFVLKKSVTIPARPYLRPAADEKEAEAVETIRGVLLAKLEQVA